MRINHFVCLVAGFLFVAVCSTATSQEKPKKKEKTAFQTSGQWKPVTDVRADVSIVYGTSDRPGMTFEERVQTWRDKGYTTHFMTGSAWGGYQDYFTGKWDGKQHLDEGQVTLRGDTIWHGRMVPYIVPSRNFIEYMKETQIKRVIDAGIDAIYLEEPEFWARAGYSEAFKREWKEYYSFEWRPQHESPENTYLSNKLKYHLYYRALNECFSYAKEYGKSKGMNVRCYVPTHSLVNYSSWQIVSPEASLASLPCVDGYIAQVWTGTSREPTFFNGKAKERVFETAYLEYGSMESMTATTGRKMFFLTDPIEDWPRDWADYKKNYQATFTAKLLYPKILIMSYSNMKPLSPEGHEYIAAWVKKGGVLVYCCRDMDPFQGVQEWWNTGKNHYKVASDHLFEKLNIKASLDKDGEYKYGKGTVYIIRKDPKEFVLTEGSDQGFVDTVKRLYEKTAKAGTFIEKNNFYLARGVYDLISVLDENVSDKPYIHKGRLIDLFDPKLPVLYEKTVNPGEQAYLLNIDRVEDQKKPQVLAAASRVYDEKVTKNGYSFITKSPLNTTDVMRVLLP